MTEKAKVVDYCDKAILFSIYAVTFFLPISKSIIEIFSILAIALYLVKKIILRESLPKSFLNFTILAYLIICFVSIFFSSNIKISSRAFFAKTIQSLAFFLVVAETLNTDRRVKNLISVFFASALLLGIDGIFQHFTHKDFIRNRPYYGLPRIHATFSTSNDFGCYLTAIIPFALISILDKSRTKIFRFSSLFLFLVLFVCLILTISRGAWFGLISTMLFMSAWIRPLGVFLIAIALFIIATHQFYYPVLRERLSNFFIFSDHSSMDRRMIWEAAWKMIMHNPLLGLGLGTFMFNFKEYVVEGYPFDIPYAHNCYLQMGAEIGIIGLSSFLFILMLFFFRGIRILNLNQQTFSWYILLASLASVLGYCVQMAVDTNFYSLDLGMLFWLLLGLGVAATKIVGQESKVNLDRVNNT